MPESLGLVGLFGLLLVKEMGLPIPIPGDLVVIGAGIAAAHGELDPAAALAAVLTAGYAGGAVQFALVRGGRGPALALLDRFGLRRHRIERHAARLRRGGVRGVALSRATPGIRVVAIAASAVAAVPFRRFALGLVLGNTVFVGFHFALGFAIGEPAIDLISRYGVALIVGSVAFALLVGAAAWWVLRGRASGLRGAGTPEASLDADLFTDWADATCPVCLTLAAAGVRLDRGGAGSPEA
jgi:membrane protein DedA with SNARE-associated domain